MINLALITLLMTRNYCPLNFVTFNTHIEIAKNSTKSSTVSRLVFLVRSMMCSSDTYITLFICGTVRGKSCHISNKRIFSIDYDYVNEI